MFNGGVVWNTSMEIAIRINRIEYFSANIENRFATLSAHYLSSDGSVREIVIASEVPEDAEEEQQFTKRCYETFNKNVQQLMECQAADEILSKKNLGNFSGNIFDWITKR